MSISVHRLSVSVATLSISVHLLSVSVATLSISVLYCLTVFLDCLLV